MTAEMWNWILASGLAVCLAVLILWVIYFRHQWNKMEGILEQYQEYGRTGRSGGQERQKDKQKDNQDVLETRESRMVSQLRQILNQASRSETRAVDEKNQVMELISDLSHQLKTPLANIVMNTELLCKEEMEEEERREFLIHTRKQAEKMQWLMENLLKASRLENGMIDFRAENTGIKSTIARAVGDVYAQASRKQIEICTEEFQDFALYHNPKWTAEAMANILENGVKYAPEKSQITIEICRLDIYTRIKISDEGPGIPETDYNRIFQRFYRGNQAEQQEGTGLGLYLAQLILQCEKGYITVTSKEGQGSSFSLFLLNRG